MTTCKICHNFEGNNPFFFREMMYGTQETFEYFKCAACGCLQIKETPDELSKYYPDNYYSFKPPSFLSDNFLKSFFKKQRAKCCLSERNLFRTLLLKLYPPPEYFEWLIKVKVALESEILDVGCGDGRLLIRMRKDGFKNLTGVDAFIERDIYYDNGVRILKSNLSNINKKFDFIMLNHSFEHMPNPMEVLKELDRLLKSDRYVLIRIPVASSYAFEKFRENWVQLDVPRHLFLHTSQSMDLLAKQANFKLEEIVFDSTEFQFWGSEQYRKGISLRDRKSLAENFKNSIFTKKQLTGFKAKANELNKKHVGDQACFYLYKP